MAQQRVALVTGGAKRVGRAIVERLAGAGFAVVFTYHQSEPDAFELRDQLSASGATVTAMQANLLDPFTAATDIWDRFPHDRLDVLVNNASLYVPSGLDEFQLDMSLPRNLMAVHVEAPLHLAERFREWLKRARGHIINMSDLLAERPWPRYAIYSASKAALSNLTLSLARELAPEVTVNAIAPGVVAWPDDYPEAEREKYLNRVPLARAGTPQDVANLVHFLVTEGTYITGQIIRLDGGRSIT